MGTIMRVVAVLLCVAGAAGAAEGDVKKLNIIAFGAHPDDCELKVGGTAAKWAQQGHRVKFVAVTNGDIGHQEMAGGPLAQRRTKEVQAAAKVLGIEVEVLDNHDGELLPTLDVRKQIIRLIRAWNADIVITHRPNDYHPDHRYTGILVQDGAYMVTVPFMCPDTPPLKQNPVYLYMWDQFQKPNPFEADVVVPVDDVMEKKMVALSMMPSQFAEWLPWHDGTLEEVPKDPEGAKQWMKEQWTRRFSGLAMLYRETLRTRFGTDADNIKFVEAFELCEYGRQPTPDELLAMFPVP